MSVIYGDWTIKGWYCKAEYWKLLNNELRQFIFGYHCHIQDHASLVSVAVVNLSSKVDRLCSKTYWGAVCEVCG